jgi:hypothetical protein
MTGRSGENDSERGGMGMWLGGGGHSRGGRFGMDGSSLMMAAPLSPSSRRTSALSPLSSPSSTSDTHMAQNHFGGGSLTPRGGTPLSGGTTMSLGGTPRGGTPMSGIGGTPSLTPRGGTPMSGGTPGSLGGTPIPSGEDPVIKAAARLARKGRADELEAMILSGAVRPGAVGAGGSSLMHTACKYGVAKVGLLSEILQL